MFYDLSGRFKYDQLTPVVNNDTYVQEFGPDLQLGKFDFKQVSPSAVVVGGTIQEIPFLGLSGKRLYQVTPVEGEILENPSEDRYREAEEERLRKLKINNEAIIFVLSKFP